jgi:hypothetical protein
MGVTTLLFGVTGMMPVRLAAAAGYLAVPATRQRARNASVLVDQRNRAIMPPQAAEETFLSWLLAGHSA